jgi:hypothetical protein
MELLQKDSSQCKSMTLGKQLAPMVVACKVWCTWSLLLNLSKL